MITGELLPQIGVPGLSMALLRIMSKFSGCGGRRPLRHRRFRRFLLEETVVAMEAIRASLGHLWRVWRRRELFSSLYTSYITLNFELLQIDS